MTPRNDKELMRWLDGEMSPAEARQLEERLERSPEDKAKVEALEQLGEVVRARYDLAATEAEPQLEALWSKIERNLEPARPRTVTRRRQSGFGSWFASHRGYVVTAVVAAAAAMAIMFAVRPTRVVPGPKEIVYVEQPAPVPAALPVRAIDIEELEAGAGSPDVIRIASANKDEPATVIVKVPGLRSI